MSQKAELFVYVGTIPDIFGYGISVVDLTKGSVETALRKAYAEGKKARKIAERTTFESSFEYFGGHIKRVRVGKAYYDNFAE